MSVDLCRCGHLAESHGVLQNEGGREGCRMCGCRLYIAAAKYKAESYPPGTLFAPSYRTGSRTNPNRCILDDPDFVSSDPDLAAQIGHNSRGEAALGYGLFWDGKVVVIPPDGIRNVPGLCGKTKVLYIAGPGFDRVQEQERAMYAKVRESLDKLPKRLTENDVTEA